MVNRSRMKWRAVAGAVIAALVVGGCAQGLGGGTYSRTEARRAMSRLRKFPTSPGGSTA